MKKSQLQMHETSRVKRFLQKDFTPYLVFAIPLGFLVIFLFWPLATTLLRAFMKTGAKFSLSGMGFENFKKFLTSALYQKSLRNSFVLSFSVVFFSILIGVPMGYIVARIKVPAKNLLLSLGILPGIMP
ncbi:MAG TPA: ABC transporter permease, partial [Sphaerochaeta sp.]|nr:ABC transporter permease [Sphaerochaeta sp.]